MKSLGKNATKSMSHLPASKKVLPKSNVIKSEPILKETKIITLADAKRIYDERLRDIYERKNPRKLKKVTDLIEKYSDDLHSLYLR